jgi:hypothetical protein
MRPPIEIIETFCVETDAAAEKTIDTACWTETTEVEFTDELIDELMKHAETDKRAEISVRVLRWIKEAT